MIVDLAFTLAALIIVACLLFALACAWLSFTPRLSLVDGSICQRTWRLDLAPRRLAIVILFDWCHWKPNGTSHGPRSTPSWFWLGYHGDIAVQRPSTCRRIWLYIRGGYACHVDVTFDRRPA
jgi:hypothetical protein